MIYKIFRYYPAENDFRCRGRLPTLESLLTINADLENKIYSPSKYSYDQLNFKPICSFKTNIYSHLRAIAFNQIKTIVIKIRRPRSIKIEKIKLEKAFAVVTDKNPSEILVLFMMHLMKKFQHQRNLKHFI
uniref:DUF7583 domain-containing protein n=1 Tax=Strongyloides venezuelensis TaxID=75913 RepID=A0A0K0FP37_STRVS